jgi:hypothetical protein
VSAMDHAMALRSPWYVLERLGFDRFDPRAGAPAIQKYDTAELVEDLVRDPRASLAFDPAVDVWAFAVPRPESPPAPKPATLRERLSPFELVPSNVCKLYQPSHQRFYAVTVELFCEVAGLPRPGPDTEVEVRYVVRRLRTRFNQYATLATDLKQLARAAAEELFDKGFPVKPVRAEPTDPDPDIYPPNDPALDTAVDLAALFRAHEPDAAKLAAFEAAHAPLLGRVGMTQELEGWYVQDAVGQWQPVPQDPDDQRPPGEEEELPMWRVPLAAALCEPAEDRSIWFGVVPTYSGEFDGDGIPKLDDHTTYVVQCLARRRRRPPHEDCPRVLTWSAASAPYRLASFFDPQGTANHRTHVKLPDFAAVAARAAKGPSAGGVQFERPAGSQLPPGPLGEIPGPGAGGDPGGDSAENCSFAIELITIVATFVFSLFLPVVVFAFQLWWLLLLKFCWPSSTDTTKLLTALETTPIVNLLGDQKVLLSGFLGVGGDITGELDEADPDLLTDKALGKQLGEALQPGVAPEPPAATPATLPDDPLCTR